MEPRLDRSKVERLFAALLLVLLVGVVALPFRPSCPSSFDGEQRHAQVMHLPAPPPLPPLPPLPPAPPLPPLPAMPAG